MKLYNVATPPLTVPEIYELQSEDEIEWSSIRMVAYNMAENHDDSLFQWHAHSQHVMDRCHQQDNTEKYYIRAVPLQDAGLVVLGSGADISLLPYNMIDRGRDQRLGKAVLEDAQGGRLQTFGRRAARWK